MSAETSAKPARTIKTSKLSFSTAICIGVASFSSVFACGSALGGNEKRNASVKDGATQIRGESEQSPFCPQPQHLVEDFRNHAHWFCSPKEEQSSLEPP